MGKITIAMSEKEQLKETNKIVCKSIGIDYSKYQFLLDNDMIDMKGIIDVQYSNLHEHVEYIAEYVVLIKFNINAENYIKEDIIAGMKDEGFDIVKYVNNVINMRRYRRVSSQIISTLDIGARGRFFEVLDSFDHCSSRNRFLQDREDEYIKNTIQEMVSND